MEELFKGESLTIVLRCHNRDGEAENMEGRKVDVVMTDKNGQMVFNFTTHKKEDTEEEVDRRSQIEVKENYLLCPIPYEKMKEIQGVYMVEIRVQQGDFVKIAQVPGVRVLDSITGIMF